MKKPIKPTAKKPTPTKTPVKKFQAGGVIKQPPVKKELPPVKKELPIVKEKTAMDALKALGEYITTFGYAIEGYNPKTGKNRDGSTPK